MPCHANRCVRKTPSKGIGEKLVSNFWHLRGRGEGGGREGGD